MYAVTFHARPRFSKDLDVWVEPGKENAARVLGALGQFGAPLDGVGPQDFSNPAMVFQIGVEPNRIDILMGIEGAAFSDAWKRRAESTYGEISIHMILREDLIVNKRALGRPKDLDDLQALGDA